MCATSVTRTTRPLSGIGFRNSQRSHHENTVKASKCELWCYRFLCVTRTIYTPVNELYGTEVYFVFQHSRMGKRSANSDNPDRATPKGFTHMRDKSTIQRLKMYRGGRPVRNKQGQILGGELMNKDKAGGELITGATGRVQPDRRWFGNVRVVGAKQLDTFREAMSDKMKDPYAVVLHSKKLPMGLLTDSTKVSRVNLLSTESFEQTFGKNKQRKRCKLAVTDLEGMATRVANSASEYASAEHEDRDRADGEIADRMEVRNPVFDKGTSKRIWGELYKVLDCSDVVVQVLDARDPLGTRSKHVEKYLKDHAQHKQLVFVLNKCDLVPTWVTRKWVAYLSQDYPTLAFHASLTRPFGKGALIALLRQFSKLHSDKKNISVGFIGYPNTGKSSVINALKAKKVCKVAPIPGETKIWQYVTLMKRVFLIDCPGIVYPSSSDTETDIVLRGVVRPERLEAPEEFIPEILKRVKTDYLKRTYGLSGWTDATNFLEQIAQKSGKLLKGGDPDISISARSIVQDWQRGRLPYFNQPPDRITGEIPSRDVNPLTVSQVIPRLGAHELLEEEEEAEDKAQATLGGAEVAGDSDSDDASDVEDDDDNDDDNDEQEEVRPAATAAGSKRGRPASQSVNAKGTRSVPDKRGASDAGAKPTKQTQKADIAKPGDKTAVDTSNRKRGRVDADSTRVHQKDRSATVKASGPGKRKPVTQARAVAEANHEDEFDI
jgi:nuclear GTP-binding protein